ncbi:MAG: SMC-Scp complex subunit ScpB [Promethearchaeota archaeon]
MNNSEEEENLEEVEQTTPEEKEEKELQGEEELQDVNEDNEVTKEDDNNIDNKESLTTVDKVGEPQTIIPESDSIDKVVEKDKQLEIRDIQKNLIEGALYAGGRPLDVEELATKLEIPKKLTEVLVNELAMDYLERTTALIIAQVGERYQMQLRPEYTESVAKFAKGGAIAERYLRTLTVIALKQPILKSIVVKIRGSGAYEHIKYLIDNDLINAVKKGRSFDLTTTDKYSEMFGLPKNKMELKKAMIQQLGVEPSDQIPEEPSNQVSEGSSDQVPEEPSDI